MIKEKTISHSKSFNFRPESNIKNILTLHCNQHDLKDQPWISAKLIATKQQLRIHNKAFLYQTRKKKINQGKRKQPQLSAGTQREKNTQIRIISTKSKATDSCCSKPRNPLFCGFPKSQCRWFHTYSHIIFFVLWLYALWGNKSKYHNCLENSVSHILQTSIYLTARNRTSFRF